jgi:hypothetical protein
VRIQKRTIVATLLCSGAVPYQKSHSVISQDRRDYIRRHIVCVCVSLSPFTKSPTSLSLSLINNNLNKRPPPHHPIPLRE